jgi:O-antigen/teichoic acid export membrane protein
MNLIAATGGSVLFFAASLVRNLFLARVVGPLDFGAWTLGLVFLQYAQWSHFSLINAYRLGGARAAGAGDQKRVELLRRQTWTASVFPAGALSLLLVVAGLALHDQGARNASLMAAATLLPFQLYAFANSSLSIMERFTVAAGMQATYSVVNLVLTVALALPFTFWGAVAAQVLAYLVALYAFRKRLALIVRPMLDWPLIIEQVRIGLPLALNGIVYSLFVTLDRTFVAVTIGLAALGQYGLTALARSSLGLIPGAIGEVVYMRAANLFGETKNLKALVPLIRESDLRIGYSVGLATMVGLVWAPWLVRLVLPAYAAGITSVEIFMFGLYFLFPQYAGVFLTVVGRASDLTGIYAGATVLEGALVLAGVRWHGIEGAAVATVAAGVVLFLAVNAWGLSRMPMKASRVALHVAECLAPVPLLAVALSAGLALNARAARVPSMELLVSLLLLLVGSPLAIRVLGRRLWRESRLPTLGGRDGR